jgi:putative flippase GtrA
VTANPSCRRFLKFNAVGAIGVAAQLTALGILHGLLRLDYLTATALAVEAAVLHNFVWHERWTWRDRTGPGSAPARLFRFNLSAGLVSVVTNLMLMRWLVGTYHVQYLIANLTSIAAGSVVNYLLSDLFVFRRPNPRPIM